MAGRLVKDRPPGCWPLLLAAGVLAAAALLAALMLATLGVIVLAAEPAPSIVAPVDPRSDGQGPGLVGSPLGVALGVIFLGVVVAAVTALVLRLTGER